MLTHRTANAIDNVSGMCSQYLKSLGEGSYYFTVDYAALSVIANYTDNRLLKLKLMVAYIIITSGKGSSGQTTWGAKAVSERTGWSQDMCKKLIRIMEEITHETGEKILTVKSCKGSISVRAPSQIDNAYIPQVIMRDHDACVSALKRIFNLEIDRVDQCACLVVLIAIYKNYREDLICCPDILFELCEPDENMTVSIDYAKGAVVFTDALPKVSFKVPGVSTRQTRKVMPTLFEEGLVRNIYVAVDKEKIMYVVRATNDQQRKLFGDLQKELRKLVPDIAYIGFNTAAEGGSPVYWIEGDLVQSVTPSLLLITDITLRTACNLKDKLMCQTELCEIEIDEYDSDEN